MHTETSRRRTLDMMDAREARKREQFAHLALIAPTPELVRQVMALNDADPHPGSVAIPVEVDPVSVPAER